jgi:alanine racemase
MVRVGLGLLGYGPESMRGDPLPHDRPALRPVARWLTRIVHVQRYAKGEPVGYNSTHTLTRDSVLGVVPAGYGDGYPLSLGNRAQVQVVLAPNDRCAAAVLGKVNMDQLVIDLTDAPAAAQQIGTTIELISNDPNSPCALPRLAELAGSSCYEMLCRLSSHLPRRHVGAEQKR